MIGANPGSTPQVSPNLNEIGEFGVASRERKDVQREQALSEISRAPPVLRLFLRNSAAHSTARGKNFQLPA
jgi:hypothetical protein